MIFRHGFPLTRRDILKSSSVSRKFSKKYFILCICTYAYAFCVTWMYWSTHVMMDIWMAPSFGQLLNMAEYCSQFLWTWCISVWWTLVAFICTSPWVFIWELVFHPYIFFVVIEILFGNHLTTFQNHNFYYSAVKLSNVLFTKFAFNFHSSIMWGEIFWTLIMSNILFSFPFTQFKFLCPNILESFFKPSPNIEKLYCFSC